jgi:hypothetical protein
MRVFKYRVLSKIFVPERDEVTREWIRLHNVELYALYTSRNIIRVNKSRPSLARHVARMGKEELHTGFWWVNL